MKRKTILFIGILIFAIFLLISVSDLKSSQINQIYSNIENTINKINLDSCDYENRAGIYLERFHETPIESWMMAAAAYTVFDSTGILVPLELALSQVQLESSIGTKGRSHINNPFNVGERDSSTVLCFKSTFEGVQAYYFLMAKDYLKCKTLDELFETNFSNCSNQNYATSKTYGISVKKQYYYIIKYIDDRYDRI
jgi:hypothetical protein